MAIQFEPIGEFMPNLENIHFKPLYLRRRDEPRKMSWNGVMKKFGTDGYNKEWRLPSIEELNIMRRQKNKIPNLKLCRDVYYWSSSTAGRNSDYVHIKSFWDGMQKPCFSYFKFYSLNVRCVRR